MKYGNLIIAFFVGLIMGLIMGLIVYRTAFETNRFVFSNSANRPQMKINSHTGETWILLGGSEGLDNATWKKVQDSN